MIDSLRRCERRARERARAGEARARASASTCSSRCTAPSQRRRRRRGSAPIVDALCDARARGTPVVFPIHPRTRARLASRRAGAARGRGRPLHRARRLPRLPLAAGRRRRDPDRLRRRPGGDRPRSASPATRCAPTRSGPSPSRTARTRCSATTRGDPPCRPPAGRDAVRDPAVGRPRRRARADVIRSPRARREVLEAAWSR